MAKVEPKVGEWRAKSTSKGTRYQIWNGKYWYGNGITVQPKGRQYQPDGYNDPYEDYNPFLEEVSTIKTKFGGSGTAVNGAGGSVRYPHDMLIDEAEDTMTILTKYIEKIDTDVDKKKLTSLMGTLYNEALHIDV